MDDHRYGNMKQHYEDLIQVGSSLYLTSDIIIISSISLYQNVKDPKKGFNWNSCQYQGAYMSYIFQATSLVINHIRNISNEVPSRKFLFFYL